MEHAGAACEPTPRLRSSTSLAALTLFALLARQGWLPAIFDERVVPLTGLKAPLPSFPFVDPDYALQPPPRVMRQFVMVLVARFRMSVAEIVTAYTLVSPHVIEPHHHSQPNPRSRCPSPQHQPPRNNQVEQMLWLNPSLLRCYSVRPIFLGCCVLAVKVSRDQGDLSLSYLLSRVQDVFNRLDVTRLSRIEHQLLKVLSSQPAPIAPQPRPRISLPHSCAPMRCRCWTGGCPWTPGNIKSTPTRSSARQRTRSSRRPCRTRARAKVSSLAESVRSFAPVQTTFVA